MRRHIGIEIMGKDKDGAITSTEILFSDAYSGLFKVLTERKRSRPNQQDSEANKIRSCGACDFISPSLYSFEASEDTFSTNHELDPPSTRNEGWTGYEMEGGNKGHARAARCRGRRQTHRLTNGKPGLLAHQKGALFSRVKEASSAPKSSFLVSYHYLAPPLVMSKRNPKINFTKERTWTTAPGGGYVVTDEMKRILAQPGFLNDANGGDRAMILYPDGRGNAHLSSRFEISNICARLR